MKDIFSKWSKDRSSLFLIVILVAFVVVVMALMAATAHSFAARMPVSVNHSAAARSTLHQRPVCRVASPERGRNWRACGTNSLVRH
ncbi:hypothetical protein ASC80_16435 [Afipia sp. Root123D2]|nr:hypothetical protein ASC80_16435 [Afipia sp. Root123D2]